MINYIFLWVKKYIVTSLGNRYTPLISSDCKASEQSTGSVSLLIPKAEYSGPQDQPLLLLTSIVSLGFSRSSSVMIIHRRTHITSWKLYSSSQFITGKGYRLKSANKNRRGVHERASKFLLPLESQIVLTFLTMKYDNIHDVFATR